MEIGPNQAFMLELSGSKVALGGGGNIPCKVGLKPSGRKDCNFDKSFSYNFILLDIGNCNEINVFAPNLILFGASFI